jgi:hypothetical protein
MRMVRIKEAKNGKTRVLGMLLVCQDSLLEGILERVGKGQGSPGKVYELAGASRTL